MRVPRVLSLALLAVLTVAGTSSSPLSASQQGPRAPIAPPVRDGGTPRPTTGTGAISGVVLSTDAQPQPVRRARVTLSQTEQGSAMRLLAPTDDAGRFSFTELPPGRYSISAARPGWVAAGYGARAPGAQGLTLALTEGQRVDDVTMAMARGAVIAGRVIDGSGQPVIGARVIVSERRIVNGRPVFQAVFLTGLGGPTDDRGVYRAYGLRAGSYIVSVSPGSGQSSAGRVITPAELQWVTSPPPPGSAAAPPPPPGRMFAYAQVFHPGTTDAYAANVVTVAAGEERDGIDIAMQLVPTVKVSGTVTRPDGQPAAAAQVLIASADQPVSDPFSLLRRLSRGTPNGQFSFTDLQPGRYTISARAASGTVRGAPPPPPPGGPGRRGGSPPRPQLDLWASADLTLTGDDIEGLSLVLQPGMTVSGRVAFEGETPPPDLGRVSVRLMQPPNPDGGPTIVTSVTPLNMVAADGSFSLEGFAPGRYDLTAFAPGTTTGVPNWMLKSAVAGGRDLLDGVDIQPNTDIGNLVVTFTDKVTELTGLLVDSAGRPAPEFYVIVFPTDASRWVQRSRWLRPPARPASDGRYRITALPPGEYYLAAITEFNPNDWFTASFLEQVVPGAITITIGEGERKTQDVKLGI